MTACSRRRVLASQLVFEVDECGSAGAPLALLLHGFPQTSYSWRNQLPALAEIGLWAIAPNQRGYSPGARPSAVADYATKFLIADTLAIAGALGAERFHLIGHDWGAQLAWLVAARYPERVNSLAVLSRPHPAAFADAMHSDPSQPQRSRHHREFQDPDAAKRLLADGARRLRAAFARVPSQEVDAYLAQVGSEAALNAALNWYRAAAGADGSPLADAKVPSVSVPTLYVWGDADASVGRTAAENTARYVTANYRFEVIEGAGHFLTDEASGLVTAALLRHLQANASPG